MDSSVLSTAAKSLESSSDSLSGWLFFFTSLVVIGLIIEYGHVFWGLLTRRKLEAKHWQEVLGGVLITAGVAGELFVQPLEKGIEQKLRSANHLIEASLIKSAEEAKAKAKDLEHGIAASNRSAAAARLDAARADERAAVANAKAEGLRAAVAASKIEQARLVLTTEGLRKENLKAAERLEAEKRERLNAEKHLAPRDVGEQYSFGQALGKFEGMRVILDVVTDAECRRLADMLETVMVLAQWKFVNHPPMDEGMIPGGVVIEYRPNFFGNKEDRSEGAARALADMLNERNIFAQAIPVSPIAQPNVIHVTIGLKPSPLEEETLKGMRERWEEIEKQWLHPPL